MNNYTFKTIKINKEVNDKIAGFKDVHEGCITLPESSIPVYVIPTNEELMIAKDTMNIVSKLQNNNY